MKRIAVLVTTFNRRDHTMAALSSLFSQENVEEIQLDVFLVDDGGTDGTGDAVRRAYPQVRVTVEDGSLFWNGGMRKVFEIALEAGYDSYLWFNDDVLLEPDALSRLVRCAEEQVENAGPAIVCGSFRYPGTSRRSYGGYWMCSHYLSFGLSAVYPDVDRAIPCDTMNGNFTLVPAVIASNVGNLDSVFRHQLGDIDYGLRARREGFRVVVAAGFFGECSGNSHKNTWRDNSLGLQARWRHLLSPKGARPQEWILFTWRHYGWRKFLYMFSPYVKTLASSALSAGRRAWRSRG